MTVLLSISPKYFQLSIFYQHLCHKKFDSIFGKVISKVEAFQSLCEKIKQVIRDKKKIHFTVLFRKRVAKCSAPMSPISLSSRLSVISAYERKWRCKRKQGAETKYVPRYFGSCHLNAWHLRLLYYCCQVRVW
jgi:hypothetical protein